MSLFIGHKLRRVEGRKERELCNTYIPVISILGLQWELFMSKALLLPLNMSNVLSAVVSTNFKELSVYSIYKQVQEL